ncbi:caspase family protein [Polycyclovorans algicola]|uniref:caspase family protein n=1 Tax=Polycyclovorans algicola TaxID=616992 RepID=UPI0004A71264|nr:caspase family protein [Polycyclovorans algicola]
MKDVFAPAVGVLLMMGLLVTPAVQAGDLHALIVGIDRYATLTPLRGAVNDARDIEQTIASFKPKTMKVLVDDQAHRRATLSAWDEIEAKAKPGDTIFVSYAGHGAQVAEAVPGQEDDGYDEIWALGGFSDSGPGSFERIVDDEWGERISRVKGIKVIMLLDACHSGTMTRSAYSEAPLWPSRFGGRFEKIEDDALPPPPPRPDDQTGARPNEIYIGGVADDRKVPEIDIGGQPRGALSYYFSRGLRGPADLNQDGQITFSELQQYLVENVRQRTESQQTPVIQSGGSPEQPIFRVSPLQASAIPLRPVRVAVRGASASEAERMTQQLTRVQSTRLSDAELVWDLGRGRVLSQAGDWVANARSAAEMQGEVDKSTALMRLRALAESRHFGARLAGGDHRRGAGERVTLTFEPRKEPYLTIINLAGTGVVNLLYPIYTAESQPLTPNRLFTLPPLRVQPPYGADHVIAIASRNEPTRLRAALAALEGHRAADQAVNLIEQAVTQGGQQIAIVGLFTGDQK